MILKIYNLLTLVLLYSVRLLYFYLIINHSLFHFMWNFGLMCLFFYNIQLVFECTFLW